MENEFVGYEQVVGRAWVDSEFKALLKSSPKLAFEKMGVQIPDGVQLHILENTDKDVFLTLPAQPMENKLSLDAIERTSPGWKGEQTGYGTCPTWHPACHLT